MYEKILQDVGLKVTSPRLKILKLLHLRDSHHWSAEALYQFLLDQDDDVGIATVYRVLTQFEMTGLVERHSFDGDHSVFELRHHDHHDHLVCVECSRVEEFVDPVIEEHQMLVAKKFGYTMTDHRLIIYGLCGACQTTAHPRAAL